MKNRTAVAISLAALFFSLTGAGFAAQHYLIVSRSQIAPHVQRQLIREARGATGPQGPAGPQGVAGPQGATGPQGSAGSVDFSRIQVVRTVAKLEPSESNPSPTGSAIAVCPAGYDVLNGGFLNGPDVSVTQSFAKDPNEWVVTGKLTNSTSPEVVEAWVECVPAS